MKINTLTVLISVVAVGLGITLWREHSNWKNRSDEFEFGLRQMSNQWNQTSGKLVEQQLVNNELDKSLSRRIEESNGYSNRCAALSRQLAETEQAMKSAAATADEELTRTTTKVKDLELQNDGLSKKMESLQVNISALEVNIEETQKQLATTQGEKQFLLKELSRLQAEKAELEHQFNDLVVLRAQVRKLRDELSIARRLDWIRRGLYGDVKGGQRLLEGFSVAGAAKPEGPGLDVELKHGSEPTPGPENPPPPSTPPSPDK